MSDGPDYHDDKTLPKVVEALKKSGLTEHQAMEAIREVMNFGVFFREFDPAPGEKERPRVLCELPVVRSVEWCHLNIGHQGVCKP